MRKRFLAIALAVSCGHFLFSAVPCFNGDEYESRRERLLAEVTDGIIVVDSASSSTDFTYLTGIESRTAKLILVPEQVAEKTPRPESWRTTLYLPEKTPRMGTWDDPVLCYKDDTETPTGIAANAPVGQFMGDLANLGNITDTLYVPFRPPRRSSGELAADLELVDRVKKLNPNVAVQNLAPLLDRLQWGKSARQIEVMRKACAITVDAYKESARYTRPGIYEYEIEALVDFIFRRRGSQRAAFIIVGSGPNSCILHHMTNDRRMGENEMLVLDIGTVYCNTSTDLTRTLPTSGKFTAEQREIYSIVLEAQKKAISIVEPGVTLAEVHEAALGVIAEAGYAEYFIHGTSHTLNGGSTVNPKTNGLHDLARVEQRYKSNDMPLVPGSMFTIEPGIYIPEKNLGVRIEDDILVTPDGYEILTADAPKEIEEVEALMREDPVFLKK
jgi:Xaa-Pro aminopeptidase